MEGGTHRGQGARFRAVSALGKREESRRERWWPRLRHTLPWDGRICDFIQSDIGNPCRGGGEVEWVRDMTRLTVLKDHSDFRDEVEMMC